MMRSLVVVLPALALLLPALAGPDAAQRRYEKALAELARRRSAEVRRYEQRSRQARELTARAPVDLVLRGGKKLERCRILQVGARELTVEGAGGRQTVEWSRLSPASHVRVAALSLPADDDAGFVALGKYCVLHERYDDAVRAFRQAAAIRPALKDRLPDVDLFRKPPVFSAGKTTRRGESIEVRYEFDDEAELEEFAGEFEETELWQAGGALRFAPDLLVPLPGWTAGLRAPLEVRLQPGPVPAGGRFWIMLEYRKGGADQAAYVVLDHTLSRCGAGTASPEGLFERIIDQVGEGKLALAPLPRAATGLVVRLAAGRLKVEAGGKAVIDVAGEISPPAVSFGGLAMDEKQRFALASLLVAGRLSEARYRRVLQEARTQRLRALFDELAEEEQPVRLPALDARRVMLAAAERPGYQQLIAALKRHADNPEDGPRKKAEKLLAQFGKRHPRFAPYWFWRGWFNSQLGEAHQALRDFDRALKLDARFVEAQAAKARELLGLGLLDAAERAAQQTIALQADNALGRATLALVAFGRRTGEAQALRAIDALEVATILDPKSDELLLELRQCRQVHAGPPWPGGRPAPLVGPKHVVTSDLPAGERKRLADELARVQALFVEFLPPAGQRLRTGQVFVFASRATYEIASALIGGEASSDTEGHFESTFKSLYLYKSEEDTGTGKLAATSATLRHEAWHQYVNNLIPNLPSWADEGLGEHFGGARFDAKGGHVFPVDRARLKNMRAWLAGGEAHMPFAALMSCSHERFMKYEAAYDQAWSMVHLFLVHEPKAYRATMMEYLRLLRAGRTREESYAATWGKLELADVERRWRAMLEELARKR